MKHAVVLYDGFCVLCSRSIQWLIKKDKKKVFRFVPLQSKQGADLLALAGPQVMQYLLNEKALSKKEEMPGSVILWMDNKPYIRSDGALLAIAQLGGIYKAAAWLRIIPKFIRDTIYNFIARNRYKWFGKRDSCFLPPSDEEMGTGNGEFGTGNEEYGTGTEETKAESGGERKKEKEDGNQRVEAGKIGDKVKK